MHGHAQAPPWAMRYPMRVMAMGGRGRRGGFGWGGFPGDFAMGGRGPYSGGRAKVSRGAVRTAIFAKVAPTCLEKRLVHVDHAYTWTLQQTHADFDSFLVSSATIKKCHYFIEHIGSRH